MARDTTVFVHTHDCWACHRVGRRWHHDHEVRVTGGYADSCMQRRRVSKAPRTLRCGPKDFSVKIVMLATDWHFPCLASRAGKRTEGPERPALYVPTTCLDLHQSLNFKLAASATSVTTPPYVTHESHHITSQLGFQNTTRSNVEPRILLWPSAAAASVSLCRESYSRTCDKLRISSNSFIVYFVTSSS